VDTPKASSENKDTKDDRSNIGSERAELEKKAAALLNLVRAMAFPLQVCHEHSHICANTARITGFEKASSSSQRANGDSEGMGGLDMTGDTARHIGRHRPEISNASSSPSDSTAFSGDRSSGLSYE
jgi:hypothetical protein